MTIDETTRRTDTSDEPVSPLAHLSDETIAELAKEFDAIHDEVYASLGDKDRKYITSVIAAQRQLLVAGRVLLLGSTSKPAWLAGTACLGIAKILENMELGHNVMHGQWDWMNDPEIHSSVWDWDTASTASSWKHSHNYVHHTYTNIRGKDKDLGYEIMRIDPRQEWHPAYLAQPLYNLLLMAFFEWGVALHDLDIEAIRRGDKPVKDLIEDLKGIGVKARKQFVKDYVGWPLISAGAFALAQVVSGGRLSESKRSRLASKLRSSTRFGKNRRAASLLDSRFSGVESTFLSTLAANFTANIIRNVWSHGVHLQPGRGGERDPRRLVRPSARRSGQHRRRPILPSDEWQPELPGRAPSVPGYAQHPLLGSGSQDQGHLRALSAALQLGTADAAVRHGPADHRTVGLPRWQGSAQARPLPSRGELAS